MFIASSPEDNEKTTLYAKLLFDGFKISGITFDEYLILDYTTISKADEFIRKANLIFLSGGDTFIQSEFFKEIDLKTKLSNYDGIIIGQSAGALNMAEDVCNSPEEKESSAPVFF